MKINLSETINNIIKQFESDGQRIIKDFSNKEIILMISSIKKQLKDFNI